MAKIAFLGTGKIGQTIAYAVLMDDLVDEAILVDNRPEVAAMFEQELRHALATIGSEVRLKSSIEINDIKDADIVVISAGKPRTADMSRRDLFADNAKIIAGFARTLPNNNPKARYIMVANPVDMMASVFAKVSGKYVISSGDEVETMRMRSFIADKLSVPVSEVTGFVGGEHGEAAQVLWSTVKVSGMAFDDAAKGKLTRQAVEDYIKKIAADVIRVLGGTTWGPGTIIKDIIKAIILNENEVMSIAPPLKYKDEIIHISVPMEVGSVFGPSLENELLSADDKKRLDTAKEAVYTAYKDLLKGVTI